MNCAKVGVDSSALMFKNCGVSLAELSEFQNIQNIFGIFLDHIQSEKLTRYC